MGQGDGSESKRKIKTCSVSEELKLSVRFSVLLSWLNSAINSGEVTHLDGDDLNRCEDAFPPLRPGMCSADIGDGDIKSEERRDEDLLFSPQCSFEEIS